ncbi:PKD domain-containing protein [Acidobacteria bacterium ACD]|nr:MAG: PKD domain-containing protein [Acidobacteriota bacterium]MCE7958597.1 PKD domain-containing protein [Acidobacteria bacterium ACB2]MDL1949214.1 PKD domain-containing protein [Acidobacteria bacterium ACD]
MAGGDPVVADPLSCEPALLVNPTRREPVPPAVLEASRAFAASSVPDLVPLADDVEASREVERLRAWNDSGQQPTRIGVLRRLGTPIEARERAAQSPRRMTASDPRVASLPLESGGRLVAARVRVPAAFGVRLRLAEVRVPIGTRFWVFGSDPAKAIGFGIELIGPDESIWTPSVHRTDSVTVVAMLPAEVDRPGTAGDRGWGFSIRELLQTLHPTARSSHETLQQQPLAGCERGSMCFTDATFPSIESAEKATALLTFFLEGVGEAQCSGILLNDTPEGVKPYLLTSRQCIPNQYSASSLEAYFDMVEDKCNGLPPFLDEVPRVNGSSLLASGAASDYSFLLLSGHPSGSHVYKGWSASISSTVAGTALHTLSNPEPQWSFLYSQATVVSSIPTCTGYPLPAYPSPGFVWSRGTIGVPAAGGAPAMNSAGAVVGHFSGYCSTGSSDPCNYSSVYQMNGAFATTYQGIKQWLSPTVTSPPVADFSFSPSSPKAGQSLAFTDLSTGSPTSWGWNFGDSTASGLQNPTHTYSSPGTYPVTLVAYNSAGSNSITKQVVVQAATAPPTIQSFTANPTAVAPGGTTTLSWTSTGGTSASIDQGVGSVPTSGSKLITPVIGATYTLTVTGPGGSATASVTIQAASGGTCSPDATTLCLGPSGRFKVQATYKDYNGNTGSGKAQKLTDDSGYFYFFTSTNVELVAKFVSFCNGSSGNWAIYASGLTDVEVTFKVTDTKNGMYKEYKNPLGNRFCTIGDGPFPCP